MAELHASFSDAGQAREALLKLEALRAAAIRPEESGTSLTALVDDAVVERAMRLIAAHGGTADKTTM